MTIYSEPVKVSKTYYRQGTSYARGTTIDGYLNEVDNQLLYERWKKEWPEPLMFSGGIKAITCEMVLEVPYREMIKTFGVKRGNEFITIARENASSV